MSGAPPRPLRAATAIVVAAILAAVPSSAKAQPSPASALGRFDEAQKLFDHAKHAEALALFQKVYEETKSPNARLMAARCLLALGRTAEGYDELSATVREAAAKAQSEPKYTRTRDAAAAELGMLEPKIGKIVVALVEAGGQPHAPGAAVSLNGKKLAPEKLGVPMAVLPGSLVLLATGPDGASVQRVETVGPGETKTITLVLPGAPPAAPGTPPAHPAPPASPVKSVGGVRVAGFAIAGLGAAGLVVFGGTYAIAQSKYNTLKTDCGGARCTDPKYADVVDAGKRMELVSNVSLVVGAVAMGAGIVMIAVGGPSEKAGQKPSTSLSISPSGAQIRGVF